MKTDPDSKPSGTRNKLRYLVAATDPRCNRVEGALRGCCSSCHGYGKPGVVKPHNTYTPRFSWLTFSNQSTYRKSVHTLHAPRHIGSAVDSPGHHQKATTQIGAPRPCYTRAVSPPVQLALRIHYLDAGPVVFTTGFGGGPRLHENS